MAEKIGLGFQWLVYKYSYKQSALLDIIVKNLNNSWRLQSILDQLYFADKKIYNPFEIIFLTVLFSV